MIQKLLEEIQADIDWRLYEISRLKRMPTRYKLDKDDKNLFMTYSIPAFYALWEGFLKSTFESLTDFLNKASLSYDDIHNNLLTHTIDNICNFKNERANFGSKVKLVKLLSEFYKSDLKIKKGIPTKSNANLKVTNQILERFNISRLNDKYNNPLNTFLFFRNTIAHGENSIVVSLTHIDEFSNLVQDLMNEILLLIQKYVENQEYNELVESKSKTQDK
jgi:MAE_28990/MAE_18760-like HEPN